MTTKPHSQPFVSHATTPPKPGTPPFASHADSLVTWPVSSPVTSPVPSPVPVAPSRVAPSPVIQAPWQTVATAGSAASPNASPSYVPDGAASVVASSPIPPGSSGLPEWWDSAASVFSAAAATAASAVAGAASNAAAAAAVLRRYTDNEPPQLVGDGVAAPSFAASAASVGPTAPMASTTIGPSPPAASYACDNRGASPWDVTPTAAMALSMAGAAPTQPRPSSRPAVVEEAPVPVPTAAAVPVRAHVPSSSATEGADAAAALCIDGTTQSISAAPSRDMAPRPSSAPSEKMFDPSAYSARVGVHPATGECCVRIFEGLRPWDAAVDVGMTERR